MSVARADDTLLQFYMSNLTGKARRNLPLAKLFGQNYNVFFIGKKKKTKQRDTAFVEDDKFKK